jgi:hypothetical protein
MKQNFYSRQKLQYSEMNNIYTDINSDFSNILEDISLIEDLDFIVSGLNSIANGDMTITIKSGVGYIGGDRLKLDSDYILTLDPSNVYNRYDLVTVEYTASASTVEAVEFIDLSGNIYVDYVSKYNYDECTINYYKGTVSGLLPVVPANELALCSIYVANGVASVVQSNIRDMRHLFQMSQYLDIQVGSGSYNKYDLLYYNNTNGYYEKANATTNAAEVMLLEDLTPYASGKATKSGRIYNDSWSLTSGPVFLSEVDGLFTQTCPTTVGSKCQIIGKGYGNTLNLDINPNNYILN